MIINDTVVQVQGNSLLVGTVSETKKENGWLFARVDWVPTEARQGIETNIESLLEIRREDYNPETEWIRCSKLINVNAEALIEALHKVAVRERDYERTLCDQYKKELLEAREETEKQVRAAAAAPTWCNLDAQQKEIKHLRSLCLRAADEIEMLDDIIIRNNFEDQMNEEYPGMASVNLLSRLRGRIKGDYVENYPELTEEE